VGAEAGLHPDDAARKRVERFRESKTLDLPSKNNLAGSVEADQMGYVLPDIDANNGEVCKASLSLGIRIIQRGGSRRHIPLADVRTAREDRA
jgi:hypothetical protein